MTARIRSDLQATPLEEGGIAYFDVRDPRSGASMRMYDFEWKIAAQLDGARPIDEIARWAMAQLGLQASVADLEEYVQRLQDLGFFDSRSEVSGATPIAELVESEIGAGDEFAETTPVSPAPIVTSLFPSPAAPALVPLTIRAPQPLNPLNGPSSMGAPPRGYPTTLAAPATLRTTPTRAKSASSAASKLVLGSLLLLVAVGVGYVRFVHRNPVVETQTVTLQEIFRFYDGAAALQKMAVQTLTLGESGKVLDVIAPGMHVTAGTPLVTLASYPKLAEDLATAKDKVAFFQRRFDEGKLTPALHKETQQKIDELKKRVTDLETHIVLVRALAPSAGVAEEVLASTKKPQAAGEAAVKFTDDRLTLAFKLPASEAKTFRDATAVALKTLKGERTVAGRVLKSAPDGTVTIELLDQSEPHKVGDEFKLVKQRLAGTVKLPPSAIVSREGGDTVYVVMVADKNASRGKATARRITIADRGPGVDEVYVFGLQPSDQVITSHPEALRDGQEVQLQ